MKRCRDVHRLVIEGQDRELSWRERVTVRMHMMMCNACRHFESQIGFLRQAIRRFPGD